MLLNKPRTTDGLTHWIEHPQPTHTVDPEAFQFVCHCGRRVDLYRAPYFKDTSRFSVICECGIGHFMVSAKRSGPNLVKQ
jgi:hypothetical protein